MKYFSLVSLFFLLVGVSALADTLYTSLDKFRAVDKQIDTEIKAVAEKLGRQQISIEEAHAAWSKLLERAKQNGEDVRALQGGEMTEELASMLSLVRNQQGRVQLLVDGSKLEMEKGSKAAEETYGWQKSQAEIYFDLRKGVDELFQP